MTSKSKKLLGKDSDGRKYSSIDELWAAELGADFAKKPMKTTTTETTAATAATDSKTNTNTTATSLASETKTITAASPPSSSAAAADKKKKKKKKKKRSGTAAAATADDNDDNDNEDGNGDGDDANEVKTRDTWYSKGAEYWANCEATNNGVLGGFQQVSPAGIAYALYPILS
jgi:hypothetical protein